jgi:TonB family protein
MTKHKRLRLAAALPIAATFAGAQPADLDLAAYVAPNVAGLAIDGAAVVALTVRASGRVEDAIALAATDRRLADAAVEAVLQWRFDHGPVGRDTMPDAVLRREVVEFDFRRQGVITSMSHLEGASAWFPERQQPAIETVLRDALETPPLRRSSIASAQAEALAARLTTEGAATVSFVIDEAGRVRVPLVVAEDDPSLGEAARALVESWRYEPSLKDGRPVLVEERKTITFIPDRIETDQR